MPLKELKLFVQAGDAHMPLNESVEALSISQAVPDQQVQRTFQKGFFKL